MSAMKKQFSQDTELRTKACVIYSEGTLNRGASEMTKLTLTNVFRLHNFSIKNDTLGHLWQEFMGVLLITASQVTRSQEHKKWSSY